MDGVAGGASTGSATGGARAEAGATVVAAITGIGVYATGIYPAFGGWAGKYLCVSTRHFHGSSEKHLNNPKEHRKRLAQKNSNGTLAGKAEPGDAFVSVNHWCIYSTALHAQLYPSVAAYLLACKNL